MQWNAQQDTALRQIAEWHKEASPTNRQVFRLFGYAGTGKTTLAREIAEGVGGDVLFCAFTGKAAHVLRRKGCPGASTIHSLIYRPKDKSKEHLRKLEAQLAELMAKLSPEDIEFGTPELALLRQDLERERANVARPAFNLNLESVVRDASLVVVDECSMVDGQMAHDLMSFGTPLLVLGDPAQLPPVGGTGFFTNATPDFMLTDIQRQARDNPILHLAHTVREGGTLEAGEYGSSRVLRGARLEPEVALGHDQIIAGRNKTRRALNHRVRGLKGFTHPLPQPNDKLVCLRNNHDLGLLNGALWRVRETIGLVEFITMELESLDDTTAPAVTIDAHTQPFEGADVPVFVRRSAEEFDFGYALTCHKSQGSQWDSVMVLDESAAFRQEARRWLYTAITRAAERVTILK